MVQFLSYQDENVYKRGGLCGIWFYLVWIDDDVRLKYVKYLVTDCKNPWDDQ